MNSVNILKTDIKLSKEYKLKFKEGIYLSIKGRPNDPKIIEDFFLSISNQKAEHNLILEILSWIKSVDGEFSIVFENEAVVVLISDFKRTFPLFYAVKEGSILVCDTISNFSDIKIEKSQLSSFITSGYSFANKSIFEGILAIQAAEVVLINKVSGKVDSQRHFSFRPFKKFDEISEQFFVESFNKLMNKAIEKMIYSSSKVNNWIVPLSGGHDSRQIINTLYKLGVKNVISFSYGKPNNLQANISQQVAHAVGYPWYFVEYTEKKWKYLHDVGLIDQYVDFAFQGVSTPHLQDFLAVYELKEKGILNEEDIFVPGHTLDMISGGHFSDFDISCISKEDALVRVVKRHSKLYNDRVLKKSPFYDTLDKIFDEVNLDPSNFQEYINWQERQGKFIVNSCRVYEFFSFNFRLPFWDRDLVEFFLALPPDQRKERRFFKEMEKRGILIPELADIPFEDEQSVNNNLAKPIDFLKKIVPANLKSLLVRKFGRKQYEAESLNQIFALRAETIGELLGPIGLYPIDTHQFLKPLFLRPTYRVDYHLLSGLYAVKRALIVNGLI